MLTSTRAAALIWSGRVGRVVSTAVRSLSFPPPPTSLRPPLAAASWKLLAGQIFDPIAPPPFLFRTTSAVEAVVVA